MSKEQQISQTAHLTRQYQQAYLHYCQQIITYLTALNWLRAMYMVKESTIYSEKRTLSSKKINQAKCQENPPLKALKHKEKLQNKEKVTLGKSLERFRYGTNVATTIFGIAKTGQAITTNSVKTVTESSGNKIALRTSEAPELARKRAELAKVDTTSLSTAQKGSLGELRTSLTLQKAGFTEQSARLPRNNGFDGVWFKVNSDGSINSIIITESKFSSSGKASLTQTKTMGQQLSTRWIDTNIQKMLESNDANVRKTGRMLQNNKGLIKTKAALIKPDGNQSFNNIKKPELDY